MKHQAIAAGEAPPACQPRVGPQGRPTGPVRGEKEADRLTLLTFKVGGQTYGLPVTSVVRIIEMVTITHLPGAPDSVQGIINLGGKAVPVMDLGQRFGLPGQAYGLHTPIILTDVVNDGRTAAPVGLIVDTVEQVLEVPTKNLEITETIVPAKLVEQMTTQMAYLDMVAKVDRQMILVLNVQALLTPIEQTKLSQLPAVAAIYRPKDAFAEPVSAL